MFRHERLFAGSLAVVTAAGMIVLAPAASATQPPADDSVQVTTQTHGQGVTADFNHLGSSLIETVVVNIDTVIVDVGDLAVILDTVSLLSWIGAPFG